MYKRKIKIIPLFTCSGVLRKLNVQLAWQAFFREEGRRSAKGALREGKGTIPSRLRAVVLLASEPRAASEKVKLCKLMAKKEERLGSSLVPRAFAARSSRVLAFYRDSKEKEDTARSLLSFLLSCMSLRDQIPFPRPLQMAATQAGWDASPSGFIPAVFR